MGSSHLCTLTGKTKQKKYIILTLTRICESLGFVARILLISTNICRLSTVQISIPPDNCCCAKSVAFFFVELFFNPSLPPSPPTKGNPLKWEPLLSELFIVELFVKLKNVLAFCLKYFLPFRFNHVSFLSRGFKLKKGLSTSSFLELAFFECSPQSIVDIQRTLLALCFRRPRQWVVDGVFITGAHTHPAWGERASLIC